MYVALQEAWLSKGILPKDVSSNPRGRVWTFKMSWLPPKLQRGCCQKWELVTENFRGISFLEIFTKRKTFLQKIFAQDRKYNSFAKNKHLESKSASIMTFNCVRILSKWSHVEREKKKFEENVKSGTKCRPFWIKMVMILASNYPKELDLRKVISKDHWKIVWSWDDFAICMHPI